MSTPCIFLGYSLTQSAYLSYDFVSHKMFVSLHVRFVETEFPMSHFDLNLPRPVESTYTSWIPENIILSSSTAPSAGPANMPLSAPSTSSDSDQVSSNPTTQALHSSSHALVNEAHTEIPNHPPLLETTS